MQVKFAVAAAACAVLSLPLSAQTLKPGLWEISNKMDNPEINAAMAQMQQQMAAMPPEQRKQMEAMMAQRGMKMGSGAGGGTSVQVCMTKEMVERNDMLMQQQQQSDCKITTQSRSGNTMRMAYSCPTPPSTGEGEFTYNGSESYTSKMTINSVQGGKPQTMKMEGSGKWLGADCGNIKPMVPPKR